MVQLTTVEEQQYQKTRAKVDLILDEEIRAAIKGKKFGTYGIIIAVQDGKMNHVRRQHDFTERP